MASMDGERPGQQDREIGDGRDLLRLLWGIPTQFAFMIGLRVSRLDVAHEHEDADPRRRPHVDQEQSRHPKVIDREAGFFGELSPSGTLGGFPLGDMTPDAVPEPRPGAARLRNLLQQDPTFADSEDQGPGDDLVAGGVGPLAGKGHPDQSASPSTDSVTPAPFK